MRGIALFAVLLGMALGTQAAPPIGETVWLFYAGVEGDMENSYVNLNGTELVAKVKTVESAVKLVVLDADGSGSNVIFNVADTTDFVEVNTNNQDRLVASATAAQTNDTLTHFTWIDDVSGGVHLVSVGNTDGSPVVTVQGGGDYLKARNSSISESTLFTYGVVGVTEVETPTGLGAVATDSQVVLDWNDDFSGELNFYTVYRSTSPGVTNTWDYSATTTNSTITDTTVTNGITYYYAVSATDGSLNETPMSDEVSATPPTGTAQPQNLSALGVPAAVLLNWRNDNTGHLDYYTVYRSTSPGVTTGSPVLTNVTASAFNDFDVIAGTTYYYRVTAVGTNGVPPESVLSDEVSATPLAAITETVLFQHIDATVAASVHTNVSGEVTNVVDQSTFGNDAVDGDGGPVLWPSTDLFASGLAGFDMGTDMRMLNLFTNGTDALLDFTGAAGSSDGFAMLVAFKTRTVTSRANIFLNTGPLKLEYQNDGEMTVDLGSITISQPGAVVEAGNTIVYALNYNALTGETTFWDSKNNAESVAAAAVYGDFSGNPMQLGGSGNDNRVFDGLIGEVKIFSTKLPADDFLAERNDMGLKWGALKPGGLTAIAGDEIVLLDWNDYNVGTVSNYTVYRSTSSPVTTNDVLTTVADSEHNDTAVVNGTTYFYAISATDTNGSLSQLSAEVSATPVAAIAGGLFQQIDADNTGSVYLTNGNEVIWVEDQTANANHAFANTGTVLFPSTSLSASGKDGLDFSLNTNRNSLLLLNEADTAGLLDFAGAASTNSGIAVLVAFKADAFEWNANPVIATDQNNGLSLNYNGTGAMRAQLGSVVLVQPGARLYEGDTVVYSFNYTAKTGIMKFWDSKNDETLLATNTLYGSFNEDAALLLGANHNSNRKMVGMIGEVKVYNKSMDDAELAIEQNALVMKWGTAVATGFDVWANTWGEEVVLGPPTDDWDDDGINNLAEYAFAGNPTNGFDDTQIDFLSDSGLVYIHPQPKDDADLNYEVLTMESLVLGTWTNEGYTSVIGTYEPDEGVYNYVSNSVPTTDPVKFIRASAEY